jgi:Na+/citrate or Na+/malate symporter
MQKLSNMTEGSAQMVGVVIAGLVAIIVGVLIWYKLNTAIFTSSVPAAPTGASTAAYNLSYHAQVDIWNATNASANTIWTLFPIVAIVVVAGVILAVVMGFGRGRGV